MKKKDELLALLQNDPFGLLQADTPKAAISAEESILVSSFEEIHNFVEEHKREPQLNIENINEFRLHSRLKAVRSDPRKIKILKKYDFLGLLKGDGIKETTIEDIISDDPLGLLDEDLESDIFSIKHVKPVERIQPEFLSRRTVCKTFAQYKDMFDALHYELSSKRRRLIKYKPTDLNVGGFYVLSGILLYLQSIDGKIDVNTFKSGARERFDGRTVCIFENGTQSNMLFRSLDKGMLHDGYSISDLVETTTGKLQITESDVTNGYIYILKSRNIQVQHIRDLYKIGHTTGLVTQRIKNSKQEATYLFADVDVVSVFRCLNVESYNLEKTLHDFFGSIKLDVELADNKGNIYRPKEWFKINLNVIEDAVKLIIENKITDYVYDDKIQNIIKR
jgi:hypothetical protein